MHQISGSGEATGFALQTRKVTGCAFYSSVTVSMAVGWVTQFPMWYPGQVAEGYYSAIGEAMNCFPVKAQQEEK